MNNIKESSLLILLVLAIQNNAPITVRSGPFTRGPMLIRGLYKEQKHNIWVLVPSGTSTLGNVYVSLVDCEITVGE